MHAYNFNFISQFASLRFIKSHCLLQYVHTQTHYSVRNYSNQDTYEKGMLKQNSQTFNFLQLLSFVVCHVQMLIQVLSQIMEDYLLYILFSFIFNVFKRASKQLTSFQKLIYSRFLRKQLPLLAKFPGHILGVLTKLFCLLAHTVLLIDQYALENYAYSPFYPVRKMYGISGAHI